MPERAPGAPAPRRSGGPPRTTGRRSRWRLEGAPTRETRGRSSSRAPGPGRDERVDEAPELAIEVDLPVGPPDDVEPAVRPQPGPDPAPWQVERDRQPEEERCEGQPDDRRAGVALRDEQRVVAEAADLDRQVEA